MKTQMTITVDQAVKQAFMNLSKKLWSNASNLISMFMANTVTTWEVTFKADALNMSIDQFSDIEIWELNNEWKEGYDKISKLVD